MLSKTRSKPAHSPTAAASALADPASMTFLVYEDKRPPYTCPECAHRLRVSGMGRHRVYFELEDEGSDHPVMDRACPRCGQGLPGKSAR